VRQIFKILGLIFFIISVLGILQKTARWQKKLKAVNIGNEITLFAAQIDTFAETGPSLHMLKLNPHS
jgi:multisubunit Na+/H+ antiporter MnhG subunit